MMASRSPLDPKLNMRKKHIASLHKDQAEVEQNVQGYCEHDNLSVNQVDSSENEGQFHHDYGMLVATEELGSLGDSAGHCSPRGDCKTLPDKLPAGSPECERNGEITHLQNSICDGQKVWQNDNQNSLKVMSMQLQTEDLNTTLRDEELQDYFSNIHSYPKLTSPNFNFVDRGSEIPKNNSSIIDKGNIIHDAEKASDTFYRLEQEFVRENTKYQRRYILFQSRSLRSHEKNYPPTKLEGLGLVWALETADEYIRHNGNTVVYTDHKALPAIFQHDNELLNRTLASWADKILSYEFTIEYVQGIHNIIPDILSRMYTRNHSDLEIVEKTPKLKTLSAVIDYDHDNYTNLTDPNERMRILDTYHKKRTFWNKAYD